MDSLYYGEHQCHCGHTHFHDVDGSVRFDADVLAQFLRNIYKGFDTDHGIEATMWREVLRIINEGTVEGLAKAKTPPTHEQDFYEALRHSNEVFAAFKVHTMGVEMASKLHDADGKLKPFGKWVEDVGSISSHQVASWLQTEYDTAVIRAHAAADWREFERNKDIMPNLRWMPTTSKEPESSHRAYWQMKLTLPVDDPFWEEHHPGDRWNCKCSLEATDDPVVRPVGMEPTKPQRGLENNPGKDGHTFSDNHPYFPKGCSPCPFNKGFKNKMGTFFKNEKKHCYDCAKIDANLPTEKKEARYREYQAYKDDPSYINVEYDARSGGLKATHKDHNIDKHKGWYETTAQQVAFKNGHKVILEKEEHSVMHKKNTEGTWDDLLFEIAAAETATDNNIRRALKHCASKPNADVAIIFFPNDNFNQETFEKGLAKYNGLKGTSQFRLFKRIYCVGKEKIMLTKKPE